MVLMEHNDTKILRGAFKVKDLCTFVSLCSVIITSALFWISNTMKWGFGGFFFYKRAGNLPIFEYCKAFLIPLNLQPQKQDHLLVKQSYKKDEQVIDYFHGGHVNDFARHGRSRRNSGNERAERHGSDRP